MRYFPLGILQPRQAFPDAILIIRHCLTRFEIGRVFGRHRLGQFQRPPVMLQGFVDFAAPPQRAGQTAVRRAQTQTSIVIRRVARDQSLVKGERLAVILCRAD